MLSEAKRGDFKFIADKLLIQNHTVRVLAEIFCFPFLPFMGDEQDVLGRHYYDILSFACRQSS
ncbi:MAG: hypothetical protein CVV49_19070 [Spirochaetae bacterium HGW-Spirochaetae-5]|nr:MAG: hypothetical protein CVV49_19070 [Spirochaetae bacterium HGW-Spirochaetae-5]